MSRKSRRVIAFFPRKKSNRWTKDLVFSIQFTLRHFDQMRVARICFGKWNIESRRRYRLFFEDREICIFWTKLLISLFLIMISFKSPTRF